MHIKNRLVLNMSFLSLQNKLVKNNVVANNVVGAILMELSKAVNLSRLI